MKNLPKGHDWKAFLCINPDIYVCKKCNVKIYFTDVKDWVLIGTLNYKIPSCEEIIMQNALE